MHISFTNLRVSRYRKSIFIVPSCEVLPIILTSIVSVLHQNRCKLSYIKKKYDTNSNSLTICSTSLDPHITRILFIHINEQKFQDISAKYHWENPIVLHHVKRGSNLLPEAYEMIFLLSGEMYCAPLNARALSTFIGMKSIEYAF